MPWTQPLPSHIPPAIRDRLGPGGAAARSCAVGRSGASVFRLDKADCGDCHLKAMFRPPGSNGRGVCLRSERDRIEHLCVACDGGPIRLPRLLAYEQVGDWSYLLTSTVAGRPGHEAFTETPLRVARLMGLCLRALHELPAAGITGRTCVESLLNAAGDRVTCGRLRPSDLRDFAGRPVRESPEKRLKRLSKRPPPDDPAGHVITHGDFCLPNVLLDLSDDVGLIDLGEVSLADRHRDLALGVRSLRHNGGQADAVETFLRWYGRDLVSQSRLEYWADLLELV